MKTTFTLAALLGAGLLLTSHRSQAQCRYGYLYVPAYANCQHQEDSCAVRKPLVPGRWTAYMGLLGLADRSGTPYAGGDLEGGYWVRPRCSTGLRGTITAPMPTRAATEAHSKALQPRMQLYSVTWSNSLLLADGRTWRLAVQAGVGVGGANVYDKAQQVPVKGGGCGCTTAKKVDTSVAPVTELGLAATYKLKGKDAPWLTLRGGYRQWNGLAPLAAVNPFSAFVVSLGVSLPDAPTKRK